VIENANEVLRVARGEPVTRMAYAELLALKLEVRSIDRKEDCGCDQSEPPARPRPGAQLRMSDS
jgi:hypothetical protein